MHQLHQQVPMKSINSKLLSNTSNRRFGVEFKCQQISHFSICTLQSKTCFNGLASICTNSKWWSRSEFFPVSMIALNLIVILAYRIGRWQILSIFCRKKRRKLRINFRLSEIDVFTSMTLAVSGWVFFLHSPKHSSDIIDFGLRNQCSSYRDTLLRWSKFPLHYPTSSIRYASKVKHLLFVTVRAVSWKWIHEANFVLGARQPPPEDCPVNVPGGRKEPFSKDDIIFRVPEEVWRTSAFRNF